MHTWRKARYGALLAVDNAVTFISGISNKDTSSGKTTLFNRDQTIALMKEIRDRLLRAGKMAEIEEGQDPFASSFRTTQAPTYIVANTRPPDAYLALRSHASSQVGRRMMRMPNGTHLQVLQQKPDGWWYVRVLSNGQEGWALSSDGKSQWIVIKELEYQDAAQERDGTCRGILTTNRSETTPDGTPDDGSRLIRADEITNSCLFHKDSVAGNLILQKCRMGFGCEVRARINSDSSDVAYVIKVLSARPLN